MPNFCFFHERGKIMKCSGGKKEAKHWQRQSSFHSLQLVYEQDLWCILGSVPLQETPITLKMKWFRAPHTLKMKWFRDPNYTCEDMILRPPLHSRWSDHHYTLKWFRPKLHSIWSNLENSTTLKSKWFRDPLLHSKWSDSETPTIL